MPEPIYKTVEEAQAEILRLQEELTTVKADRDNYSTQVSDLQKENEKVRELNQQYFLKLTAQYNPNTKTEEDEGHGWKFQNKFHHTYKIVVEDNKVKLKFNPHASLYILTDEETYSIPDDIMECLNGINIEIVRGIHFDKVYMV